MKFVTYNNEEKEAVEYMLESYNNPNPISRYLYQNFYNAIEKILKKTSPADKILEIGCGLGESSLRIKKMLNEQHFEVSEYNKTYVKILQQSNFPIHVRQESVFQLDRQDNEFDVVLLLEVLEHLDDYELALSEIFRITRQKIIISVPNEPIWSILNLVRGKYLNSFGNTPGHINRWNANALGTILSHYGNVKAIYKSLPWVIFEVEVR